MITLDQVEARNGRWRLGPISYASPEYGCVALVGHNAAGKSTLMRAIVGLQRPVSGSVRVVGLDPYRAGDRATLFSRLGFVAQSVQLPERATVAATLGYGAWLKGVHVTSRAGAVERAAEATNVGAVLGTRIGELSGGMQRRVAIAMGLVHDPAVLVLDEPSAALDPVQRVDLQEVIKDLAATRLVMISTHLIEDISVLADSVLVIREGRLAHAGSVQDLISGSAEGRGSSALERAIFSMLKRQEVA